MFFSSYPQFQVLRRFLTSVLSLSWKDNPYPVDVLHKEEWREISTNQPSFISVSCSFDWLPIAVWLEAWSSLSRPDLSHNLSLCCSYVRLLEPNLLLSFWFTQWVFLHVEDWKADERVGLELKHHLFICYSLMHVPDMRMNSIVKRSSSISKIGAT